MASALQCIPPLFSRPFTSPPLLTDRRQLLPLLKRQLLSGKLPWLHPLQQPSSPGLKPRARLAPGLSAAQVERGGEGGGQARVAVMDEGNPWSGFRSFIGVGQEILEHVRAHVTAARRHHSSNTIEGEVRVMTKNTQREGTGQGASVNARQRRWVRYQGEEGRGTARFVSTRPHQESTEAEGRWGGEGGGVGGGRQTPSGADGGGAAGVGSGARASGALSDGDSRRCRDNPGQMR